MSDIDDAQALFERAQRAVTEDRLGDAVGHFDELIARFRSTADPDVDRLVGDALYGKGHSLERLERAQEALAVYDEMVARYVDATEMRGQLARALLQQGIVLTQLDR